ncbi:gamma carbonic anhydrase family protein [Paraburkholderia sp. CNPSo 3274]|uniref:gamma carbonic anhydrase family protein n=1 Tax=Paraburkholderia sp. CNPSo 3274 TaxID=2940932 RepID=UPI0020B8FA53|nr:gamma carbonic anhydrase family protein [Paraburkholderia sp. CNPSo 3274]MCP3712202.1 gamma carbonic anhydrase family protein [Paraburkholderia sp. CNPSo 3274]
MSEEQDGQQFGTPSVHKSAFVAHGVSLIGDVQIGERASIWFNCVLRGDVQRIVVGARSNIQDGSILHGTTNGAPTLVGSDVTVGHGAILHACTIEDRAFVGFGARVLDGAVVCTGGMLAAGAVLTPGKLVAAGELWAGNPARLLRPLSEKEAAAIQVSADRYAALAKRYMFSKPLVMHF